MKALTVEKAQEIRAGKGHYHWICRDWANFTSKAYSSYAAAGAAADAHVAKYCKWADRIFTEIIRKTAAAVFQIGGQIGAAILNIGDSFIHSASTDRALLIKPRQKAFYYRLFFFKTSLFDSIEGRIL